MGNLQKLTDDHLVFKTQSDGSRQVKIAELGEGKLTAGTNLIRQLNSTDKLIFIDYENSMKNFNEKYNFKNVAKSLNNELQKSIVGQNGIINFSDNESLKTIVEGSNSTRYKENVPPYIALGHELIHTLHYVKNIKSFGKLYNPKTNKRELLEELHTIGIIGPFDIATENELRKEHGILPRISHEE